MSHTKVIGKTHLGSEVPMEKARLHILKRIMAKVEQTEAGCWIWNGFCSYLGYGHINVQGRPWAVHRLTYTLFKGEIPGGMQACHTCDTPACCNPDHLFLGSASDNAIDSRKKNRHFTGSKTECSRGHPLSGDNLYVSKNGRRHCKTCTRARLRIEAGWPVDLAYTLAPVPHGHEPVAATWKNRRGKSGKIRNNLKTDCKSGHPLSGDNLYIVPKTGHRQCRACRLAVVKRIQDERRSSNGTGDL